MIKIRIALTLLLYSFPVLAAGLCYGAEHVEDSSDLFKRDKSIYLIHSTGELLKQSNGSSIPKRLTKYSNLMALADYPSENPLLPIKDAVTSARRIEKLTKALESAPEGERAQQIRFNLAYEFFILYLHFQHKKFFFSPQKDETKIEDNNSIPVSENELLQYLLWSQFYFKPLLAKDSGTISKQNPSNIIIQGNQLFKSSDDISFYARNQYSLYLNVYFLALMVECEIMAGEWTSYSVDTSISYDIKTWNWLNKLWSNYKIHSRDTSAYAPPADVLLSLYELYIRYHFLGRYLVNSDEKGPYLDTVTRNLLTRIILLQKKVYADTSEYKDRSECYIYYLSEAAKDGGKTSFLPSLFFARRGRLAITEYNATIPKIEIFYFYRSLFDNAAEKIRYNIPYRSRLYNEIILLGLEVDNLRLMEEVLYEYGLMSMRISQNEEYAGTYIENSSRLTMACLIANILDKKRRSGLNQDLDKYRNLANSLCPLLISKENDYWEYASMIHGALATFYSGQNEPLSETFAMYHARQAFLAPCEKTSLTYGKDQWKEFFNLPGELQAVSSLKLFLYFHNKYPTSPYATIPKEYNAFRIIKESMK
jgi:hypothetical protein